jgi:protein phosphatase
VQAGDVFLLCSDGLTNMVPDSTIGEILARNEAPALLARALVEAANEKGGLDNITAIVIRVLPD